MSDIQGFTSAPIKLAALISDRRRQERATKRSFIGTHQEPSGQREIIHQELVVAARQSIRSKPAQKQQQQQLLTRLAHTTHSANSVVVVLNSIRLYRPPQSKQIIKLQLLLASLTLLLLTWPGPLEATNTRTESGSLVASSSQGSAHAQQDNAPNSNHDATIQLRHQAHYLNIVPSTHFHYKEGRQLSLAAAATASGSPLQHQVSDTSAPVAAASSNVQYHAHQASASNNNNNNVASHIYKRSSALLTAPTGSHYPQLVSSSILQRAILPPLISPLISRRMMSEHAQGRGWTGQVVGNEHGHENNAEQQQQQLADLLAMHLSSSGPQQQQQQQSSGEQGNNGDGSLTPMASTGKPASNNQQVNSRREKEKEAALLRQKQHIQYHDQWPSMAGKCHKRTLNFCASVLPFNTTTFPNIIGDTNRFEVKRSLPFFGFLAKSACNKRLDELLCLLLEPPCSAQSGLAVPPCKKFCRLALEGCNEYIPATLAMSSVFDCRQYPDSNDPSVCINLAQGSKCAADEFKCPDKTCIPRNWLCDGVRDCIFAADEANCTALTGIGLQASVCSTEEFKCDGKCVPKAWKCDGERDCLDGSDEEACDQRPRCGPDRFRCADGNGCLPKRWVCDGKAECRDGSDEMNCEQLECSENDFKCDNGICIPKLWRCDRQPDCKDASDERACTYPTIAPITTTSVAAITTTFMANLSSVNLPTTTTQLVPGSSETPEPVTESSAPAGTVPPPPSSEPDAGSEQASNPVAHLVASVEAPMNYYTSSGEQASGSQQQQQQANAAAARQRFESSLSDDISRIIQQDRQESAQAPSMGSPDLAAAEAQQQSVSGSIQVTDLTGAQQQQQQQSQQQPQQRQASKELKKFDYDIIQSAPNMIQLNDLSGELMSANQQQQHQHHKKAAAMQQMQTQIDFVPQQQQQQARQATPAAHGGELHTSQQQQQQQFRGQQRERNFGQALAPKPSSEPPLSPVGLAERVPIYRSLFKSLKGGQARLVATQVGHSAEHGRYTGRRRRDRNQAALALLQAPPSTTTGADDPQRLAASLWTSAAPTVISELPSSPAPASPAAGDTQTSVAPAILVTPHQRHGHGVASYLQLLNSRYNLRLARVSPPLVKS